jgi:hypothetical protein
VRDGGGRNQVRRGVGREREMRLNISCDFIEGHRCDGGVRGSYRVSMTGEMGMPPLCQEYRRRPLGLQTTPSDTLRRTR